MTRTAAIALSVGVVIGLAAGQMLPSANATTPSTEIITKGEAIMVVVNGQERARFDGAGLHVNGDIAYSGSSIDTVNYTAASSAPAEAHP